MGEKATMGSITKHRLASAQLEAEGQCLQAITAKRAQNIRNTIRMSRFSFFMSAFINITKKQEIAA